MISGFNTDLPLRLMRNRRERVKLRPPLSGVRVDPLNPVHQRILRPIDLKPWPLN